MVMSVTVLYAHLPLRSLFQDQDCYNNNNLENIFKPIRRKKKKALVSSLKRKGVESTLAGSDPVRSSWGQVNTFTCLELRC